MLRTAKDTGSSASADSQEASVRSTLQPVLEGLGFSLIELSISKHRGSVRIRAVIYNGKSVGTDDCSRVHRAIMPRLELAFENQDVYLEVSSPGIDRLIKDTREFAHYLGRKVRCYRTDITEWTAGILESADEKGIDIKTRDEVITRIDFDVIAKARLDNEF